ncbi:MAG TPA: hypothetical protein VGS07_18445 [Thermoanaerobaculia bacterium]|jgi:hypothetical protein|nr:hypothetical protein [Thermoanaerobaculia bacterium]
MALEKKLNLEAQWALLAGLGTFLLYLFGYLVLRSHLAVLGVDTGLSVLDQRYLFAGAQFFAYLLPMVPIALVLVLVTRRVWQAIRPPGLDRPDHLLVIGLAVSVTLIQLVLRKCLPFTNLLLQHELPSSAWVQALLLDTTGALRPLYFTALLTLTGGVAWLLFAANRRAIRPSFLLNGALICVLLVQFLLLPVNFGMLVANQEVPRVTTIEGKEELNPDMQVWRVWEGADSVTFLVRRLDRGREMRRTLLTLDKKNLNRTEISGYDDLIPFLYAGEKP